MKQYNVMDLAPKDMPAFLNELASEYFEDNFDVRMQLSQCALYIHTIDSYLNKKESYIDNASIVHESIDKCGDRCEFEKPKGKWGPCYEYNNTGMYYRDCPFCYKGTITGDFDYCPHCGAKLEN